MNTEELRLITTYASLAPSIHNTRPWRFTALGHTVEVHADPERQLSYLDESARQLHLSCGAAVEFARLAFRALGYSCIVRLAPRADDPLLVATLTAGGPDTALAIERRLFEAGARRYTDRGPYADSAVPSAVIARMREAAAAVGCWVRVLDRPGDRLLASMLLQKAAAIEAEDPRYRDELDRWRRTDVCVDGVPVAAAPRWPADLVPDVPLRDFRGTSSPHSARPQERPDVERDTLVLLGSDADDRLSWLRTGRALAALLLTATDANVVAQPLGQVTDIPATRVQLQRVLGLLGYPQLLLRMGYGSGRPTTGRRPVDETLAVPARA